MTSLQVHTACRDGVYIGTRFNSRHSRETDGYCRWALDGPCQGDWTARPVQADVEPALQCQLTPLAQPDLPTECLQAVSFARRSDLRPVIFFTVIHGTTNGLTGSLRLSNIPDSFSHFSLREALFFASFAPPPVLQIIWPCNQCETPATTASCMIIIHASATGTEMERAIAIRTK